MFAELGRLVSLLLISMVIIDSVGLLFNGDAYLCQKKLCWLDSYGLEIILIRFLRMNVRGCEEGEW